jgi:hypothetical protein
MKDPGIEPRSRASTKPKPDKVSGKHVDAYLIAHFPLQELSCQFIQLFEGVQCFHRADCESCRASPMRLFQPASRSKGFGHVKSINGRPLLWSKMAPSRNYSSSIERVKVTPWPSTSRLEVCMKRRAYIALGSNLGDRIAMIEKACNEMSARGIRVTRTSSLWETEPMYVVDQSDFINGVCEVGLVSFVISRCYPLFTSLQT